MQPTMWHALERIARLTAVSVTWRKFLGEHYTPFASAFLDLLPEPALVYPCENCACFHDVTIYGPDDIIATCSCEPLACYPVKLTDADIQVHKLNWTRFARALCHAFSLNSLFADLQLYQTCQIGAWSADSVPVILTIQKERHDLHSVIAKLGQRLARPFILLAPTAALFDVPAQEFLATAHAAFFPLETTVVLTPHGTLQPTKTPGELFAKFAPQPKDSPAEDVARQTLALAKALDSEKRVRKAPVYTVFLLYCSEGLTVNEIAKRCRCDRTLVLARLKSLRQKLGRDLAELRQYSSQLGAIDQSLSDPRARNIYRKGAAHGDEQSEE